MSYCTNDFFMNGLRRPALIEASESKVRVGLVQITEPMQSSLFIPYSVLLLQSYVMKHASNPERYVFGLPVFLREPIEIAVDKLLQYDVLALSLYTWNVNYSLALAQALKLKKPDVFILCGGPQVPDNARDFLSQYSFIDLCCHGEGEIRFLEVLETFPKKDWSHIAGVSFFDQNAVFQSFDKPPRLREIKHLPSPYLDGSCLKLLHAYPGIRWVAIWETNRGCPFSCSFCDWGSAVQSKLASFDMERLSAELDWFGQNKISYVYCCDSNFGILARDIEVAEIMVVKNKKYGFPRKIITQMSKNKLERVYQIQNLLFDADMNMEATLSLQSVATNTLTAIKRDNISLQVYADLLTRFQKADIPTYTDMLVGLPGDTVDSFLNGVDTVISQGQHQKISFWNVYILPNAEMAQPEYRQQYGIETVFVEHLTPFAVVQKAVSGISEMQEMIVATNTMTRNDWVIMQAYAWLAQILYFGKMLQLPLLLLQNEYGLKPADVMRAFIEEPLPSGSRVLFYVRQYLLHHAGEMLQGKSEFIAAPDIATGVQIWYPLQSFVLTYLLYSPELGLFFSEAKIILQTQLHAKGIGFSEKFLEEAILLSKNYFSTHHPGQRLFQQRTEFNLWDIYQGLLKGQKISLERVPQLVTSKVINGELKIQSESIIV